MVSNAPDPEDLADAFFTVAHGLKRTVNARVQHTGLSLARLRVLFQLTERSTIRMGELSACVDVAPRTMTSTVEAMERDGLVQRRPDPHDRRATIVSITEAGRRSFDEGRRQQAMAIADVFEALDADQRLALKGVLDELLRAADAVDDAEVSSAAV
ncbi:MAG TPA: MarR family winged helix-turn-helix transcriptional regulator [Acidimicrobiales bacterium]|jgi:DNA-binding MarR family transcriptional regulator|nr:MarR family winged helix-turn-helix transcriptional regulator [Acidimicrobiales bacterium]